MLLALSLRDFVIVDRLNLNFEPGLTVLTGETGAGKSITLDALGLLLGDKADFGQVRRGATEAQLSALFDLSHLPELQQDLQAQGLLEADSQELTIRRIIDAKGKSRSFINNQAATLVQLKNIGEQLIDIHGQNAHHSLNKEATQRHLLDAFSGSLNLVGEVKQAYHDWQNAAHAFQAALNQTESLAIERERLQWQQNELAEAQLQPQEWDDLNQSHDTLAHAADLLQAAQWVEDSIDGDEHGLQSRLYQCQQQLQHLVGVSPRFAESLALLQSVEAELGEVCANMRAVASSVEIDPEELNRQAQRLQTLTSLARKYRVEPQDLPAKQQQIEAELAQLTAAADTDALQQQALAAEQHYRQLATQLSQARQQAAQKLSQATTDRMQALAMSGAQFAVELQAAEPHSHGLEHIQYLVAANKGSELRPLAKVASGGELSRISLALQVVTSQYTAVPTLIFDEVDSGIGGRVAQVVGRALRALGERYQVLVITHLPQVAACGQQHWQVSKQEVADATVSQIQVLDECGRIDEIARMLGGETITATTREHARELLQLTAE